MAYNNQILMAKWDSTHNLFVIDVDPLEIGLNSVLSIKSTPEGLFVFSYPLVDGKRKRVVLKLVGTQEKLRYYAKQIVYTKIPPHNPPKLTMERNQVLVLLNPYSGQKKALTHWINDCKPILEEADINYTLVKTEYAAHAIGIIQKMNLNNYTAIIILSGDGMISEVLTGLLTRQDRERALKMPILHIPAGTANALAAAVAFQAGEPFSPRGNFCPEMALMIGRPSYKPLRLCHVETAVDGHKLMFLTAVWGLIADIDLGSERFRWAGLARLHIEAFVRVAQLPTVAKYKGRISYKPVIDKDLIKNTRLKSDEIRSQLENNYFQTKDVKVWKGEESTANGRIDNLQTIFEDANNAGYKFPRLKDDIPSDWTVIEGEYAFVCISSISHIGSDLPYCPSAKLGDEVMYLSLVDWRTIKSRFHIAHLLITMDRCLHLDHECFQMIPVIACRVEPEEGSGGYVAIDGEPVTSGSAFQVTTTNLVATVIGRQ